MPRIEYGGQIHDFPDDFTDADIAAALEQVDAPEAAAAAEPSEFETEAARIAKERASKPTVPTYTAEGEARTPEMEARDLVATRERRRAERKLYESRNYGERARDTGAFALSAPVRMVTQGHKGAGDVADWLGFEETAKRLEGGEQDFAWANQPGLELAAKVGTSTAGIPFLNTMGGVAGQTAKMGNLALKDAPRTLRHFARSERGAGGVPGAPAAPAAAGGAPEAADSLMRRYGPTRNDLISAGERINQRLPAGENYNLTPNMIAGGALERSLAGGLEAIPYAGTPITNTLEKGLYGLGRAREMATEGLGVPGDLGAGSAIRSRVADWMKRPTNLSDQAISEMYDNVGKMVKDVPANLQRLKNLRKELQREKERSTTGAHDAALRLIDDMLDEKQFPKGMPYKDLLEKRKEIGARMSGKIVNEAGTSQPTLERIYGAMTEDMKFALRRGGGQKAVDAWEEANTAAQNVADQRKVLARLIGEQGEVPPEKIIARIKEMGRSRRGDVTALRILKRILPEDEFGDLAATALDDIGRSPKNGEFTFQRFTSDYGRYSEAAKRVLFGEQKAALDDIAMVAQRFEKLPLNTSKTGVANAVLQLLMNPFTLLGAGAAVATDISTLGAAGATMGGFRAGRSVAFTLSKPAVAREASKVFKAYYNVVRGGSAIAAREAELSAALRSFSTSLAAETGGNAAEIQQRILAQISRIRRKERQ